MSMGAGAAGGRFGVNFTLLLPEAPSLFGLRTGGMAR